MQMFVTSLEAPSVAQTREEPVKEPLTDQANRSLLYILIFFSGFALRFGFVLWKRTYLPPVPDAATPFGPEVCCIAKSIALGKGFCSPFFHAETGPTAWIAPVYPYLVAGVFRMFGIFSNASALVILGLQCAMAGVTGVMIYILGTRTFGERIGFWSAWIWSLSPFFFRWPTTWIWDFTASALLCCVALLFTLDAAEKRTLGAWLKLGAIWALIALTNPALLSLMFFSLSYATYCNYRAHSGWIRPLRSACILFGVLVSPWLIRNVLVFGQPVFFRSNYPFEFYLGNYHYSNGMGFSGRHPNNNPRVLQKYVHMGELPFIAEAKKQSLAFVRQYPGEFLDLTAHRALWFWDGTPIRYQANDWWQPWELIPLSVVGWIGFLVVLTRRPRGWFLFAATLLIYPIPYYLAYPNQKYRHAIEPELLLLGVYAASVVWKEIAERRGLQAAS
jgi:4-amino-4-deoxy-L-arabinose transferase-like glycosyltransferase